MATDIDAHVWQTAVGTAVGYGLILLAMFVVLFVLPYLAFRFVPGP